MKNFNVSKDFKAFYLNLHDLNQTLK